MKELERIKNLDSLSEGALKSFIKRGEEAARLRKKYQGKEITGQCIAELADYTVEQIYIQDIVKYDSLPLMYWNGIFLSIDYRKKTITDRLDTTLVEVTNIDLAGTYSEQ